MDNLIMNPTNQAIEILTHRIVEAARTLTETPEVVVEPHAVAGNFVCRVHMRDSDRRAYKKLFNGTTVGDWLYFTQTTPA